MTTTSPIKRMLLVGEMQQGQLPYFCANALRDLGVTVAGLDRSASPFARWLTSPLPLLPMLADIVQRAWMNWQLPRQVRRYRPDALLVFKGSELRADVLRQLNDGQSVRLLNWNPDSPLNPLNSSQHLIDSIPLYDIHFTWGRFLIPEFERLGAKRVDYLPFCYAPELHYPVPLSSAERAALGNDVVFTGTWEPAREAALAPLADFDLGIWGNHWHRLGKDSPLHTQWRGVADGDRMAPVLTAAKIALNFVRSQNGSAHNMRTYEAPACGTFMLTTRTDEQLSLFGEDEGAAFFDSSEELRAKIRYYLDHDAAREQIAKRGYEIVQQGNRYVDRMQQVLTAASDLG